MRLKRVAMQAPQTPPVNIQSIQKRADFLRLNQCGHKFIVSNFILLCAPSPTPPAEPTIRLGLTVTKKVGNAVIRNRIKRRLRAAFREVAPQVALPGHDYVLIARKNALLCPYATLIRDLHFALPRVQKKLPSASAAEST